METPPGPEQFTQYPRMRAPKVTLDVIGDAFQLFSKNVKVWLLAALPAVAVILLMTIYVYVRAFTKSDAADPFQNFIPDLLISLGENLLFSAVTLVTLAGLTRMAIRQIDGFPIQPSDAYKIGNRIPSLVISSIVVGILATIGACLCLIPYFIVLGLSLLVIPIIVVQGVGPFDAVARSMEVLKAHLWPATGLALVLLIINGIGGGFCGVGLLITLPGVAITMGLVYREFFPVAISPNIAESPAE